MPAGESKSGTARPGSNYVTWAKVGSVGVGAGAALYLAYKAYCGSKEARWVEALANYGRAVASLSSSSALLARDLHAFLQSDTAELPPSLRQLNRLLQSSEVQATLSCAAQALMRGVSNSSDPHAQPVVDKLLEAILSDRGRSLVGMAMGMATKNATATLCDFVKAQLGQQDQQGAPVGTSTIAAVMRLLSSEQGERLLSLLVTKSMKTAVATYMESTAGYNTYEDFLSSISKQNHRDAVSTIMSRVTAAFCQEVASACMCASNDSLTANSDINVNNITASTSHVASVGTNCKPCFSSRNAGPTSHHGPPPPSTLTPSSSLSSPAPSSAGEECLLCSQADHHHPQQQQQQQRQQQQQEQEQQQQQQQRQQQQQEQQQEQEQEQEQQQEHGQQQWPQHRRTRSFEHDLSGTPISRVSEHPQLQSAQQLELQPDGDGGLALLPLPVLFSEGGSCQAEVHTPLQQQQQAESLVKLPNDHHQQQQQQQQGAEAPSEPDGGSTSSSAAGPHPHGNPDTHRSVFVHAAEVGMETSAPRTPVSQPLPVPVHQHDPTHDTHQQHRQLQQQQQQQQQQHCQFQQSVLHQHQQHQQQQVVQARDRLTSPVKPVWVRRVVELVREQEVRALCLDLVTSATREATRSTLDTVSLSIRASLPLNMQALHLQVSPVCVRQVVICVLLVLCLALLVGRVMGYPGSAVHSA